jgi:hypothetical protein
MAVTLDFQVDETVLSDDRQYNPAVADPAVIETTYFTMPVRFSVDDAELLETPGSFWLPQPVLGFATHLGQSLDTLRSTGAARCSVADAGTLNFQRRGEQVRITCSFNGVEVEVSIDDLARVFEDFRERVEAVLRTRVPELATHPSWSTWFPAV